MELTDEQKKKLKALHWSSSKNRTLIGLKTGVTIFLADSLIIVLDVFTVHSQQFVFWGTLMTAIFAMSGLFRDSAKEYDRVSAEVKKILENK